MAKIKTFLLILFFVFLSCFFAYRFHDQITIILEKIFTTRLSEESYPVKLKKIPRGVRFRFRFFVCSVSCLLSERAYYVNITLHIHLPCYS